MKNFQEASKQVKQPPSPKKKKKKRVKQAQPEPVKRKSQCHVRHGIDAAVLCPRSLAGFCAELRRRQTVRFCRRIDARD